MTYVIRFKDSDLSIYQTLLDDDKEILKFFTIQDAYNYLFTNMDFNSCNSKDYIVELYDYQEEEWIWSK